MKFIVPKRVRAELFRAWSIPLLTFLLTRVSEKGKRGGDPIMSGARRAE